MYVSCSPPSLPLGTGCSPWHPGFPLPFWCCAQPLRVSPSCANSGSRTSAIPYRGWGRVQERFLEGAAGNIDAGRDQPFWRQTPFLFGLGAGLVWCLLQGAYGLYPDFPNTRVRVPMAHFITEPRFGGMWAGVDFSLSATILGLALFMDLHVCMSLVLGFFLFRAQYWFSHAQGLVVRDFPFRNDQAAVAYLTYTGIILISARRYLGRYLRAAWTNVRREGDILKPREALSLLALSFAGAVLWTRWMGLDPRSMLLIFVFLGGVLIAAAKLRAECGIPHSYLFASNVFVIVPVLGGMRVLGPQEAFVGLLLLFLFSHAPAFFMIPGIFLEAQELGRRFRIRRSHILATIAIGLTFGLAVGGWSYFGLIYASGTESLADGVQRRYTGELRVFDRDLGAATLAMKSSSDAFVEARASDRPEPLKPGFKLDVRHGCLLYAGTITAVLTVLRQIFAGFWFHPVGFLLGYTVASERIWGSVLLALLIRYTVLKLGGARAVREGLQPFAMGLFLAGVISQSVFATVEALAYFRGAQINYFWGRIPF